MEDKELIKAKYQTKRFLNCVKFIHQLSGLGLLPECLAQIEDILLVDRKYRVIVYEYCRGRTLHEDVLILDRFEEPKAKAIAEQLLRGLRFLHSKNIYHGHITPEYIVFKNYDENRIKLTGLGTNYLMPKEI